MYRSARQVDLRPGHADAQLHGLEVAHAHAGVVGTALLHRGDRQVERRLRVADDRAGEAARTQREERHPVERVRVGLCAGEVRAAAGRVHGQRPVVGDEDFLDLDRLAAGPAHAERVPVVDDHEVLARHHAHEVVDDLVAVLDDAGELVPGRGIHARGEIPVARQHDAAVDLAPLALRVRNPRSNDRVRVVGPDFFLRPRVVEREHPVMDRKVADVPCRGGIAAADDLGDVEDRNEIELHAAPALGLQEAQQPVLVQQCEDLGRQLPRLLRGGRELAQLWNDCVRPAYGLLIVDIGKPAALVHPQARPAIVPALLFAPSTSGIFE